MIEGYGIGMASQQRKFLLRLPDDLHARINEAACYYHRSMNAEIVARLEHSLLGIPTADVESSIEPAFFSRIDAVFRRRLSNDENTLVRRFRRLSPQQQAALLALLGS